MRPALAKPRSQRLPLVIASVILLAALAGCDDRAVLIHDPHATLLQPPGTISIHQLAGRLGLEVARASAYSAALQNQTNSVVIFAPPRTGVFVNGQRLGYASGVTASDGTIFVPLTLVATMQASLRPLPPPPPPAEPTKQRGTVVIDPGHGGRDPGAIAVTGMFEKDVVLPISLAVRDALTRRGVKVLMTRTDDRFIELNHRAQFANRARADLFVSIHADSAANHSARGHTVYVARAASPRSIAAAKRIDTRLTAEGISSRGTRRADYRVLVRTSCPAVLVEVGYLSNGAEARRLATKSHRQAIAQAIAAGIIDSLGD